jgi:proline dehydrogenase
LTQLGLDVDPTLCRENMRRILTYARERGLRVTIDMESREYTQRTLDLYRALRDEDGFDNVIIVIQSYLYRSDDDIAALAEEGGWVRLCKGAYKELASVAYPKKRDVDAAYIRVYVPFGTEWYPYFMRRLAERPANLWFFVSNLLRG